MNSIMGNIHSLYGLKYDTKYTELTCDFLNMEFAFNHFPFVWNGLNLGQCLDFPIFSSGPGCTSDFVVLAQLQVKGQLDWPGPKVQLQVQDQLYWPEARANTADLRPVTGPIWHPLNNDILLINYLKRVYSTFTGKCVCVILIWPQLNTADLRPILMNYKTYPI